MRTKSKFCHKYGVLFAADLPSAELLVNCVDKIHGNLAALKLGNKLLYETGLSIIGKLKDRYQLPIIVDLKLTDVEHIASQVCRSCADYGADAVVLSGICGEEVFESAVSRTPSSCEVWAFTEFTNDSGLIDEALADQIVGRTLRAGALGFQAPGTRPYRIADMREDIGDEKTIMACGIGIQGGNFGGAISSGANFEIVGRSIYAHPDPRQSAESARRAVEEAWASRGL